MFLSREIDKKPCQNYTKTYIYKILYKSCSIKQLRKQFENYYIQQEPENLKFAPFIIF